MASSSAFTTFLSHRSHTHLNNQRVGKACLCAGPLSAGGQGGGQGHAAPAGRRERGKEEKRRERHSTEVTLRQDCCMPRAGPRWTDVRGSLFLRSRGEKTSRLRRPSSSPPLIPRGSFTFHSSTSFFSEDISLLLGNVFVLQTVFRDGMGVNRGTCRQLTFGEGLFGERIFRSAVWRFRWDFFAPRSFRAEKVYTYKLFLDDPRGAGRAGPYIEGRCTV